MAHPQPDLPSFPSYVPQNLSAPGAAALTEVVRSMALLSASQGQEALALAVAEITRRTLKARFALLAVLEQQEWYFQSSGEAPCLLESLRQADEFFDQAVRAAYPFRQKTPFSDQRTSFMKPDTPDLESMIACPVRIKGAPAGLLLAFGKIQEPGFSEEDGFVIDLLTTQAAALFESSRLYQDLQNNLRTTQILYELSLNINRADDLPTAAQVIIQTTQRLFRPESCGLLLFAPDGNKEAEARLPAAADPPYDLVHQVISSRQMVFLARDDSILVVCVPIQTVRRCYGALWLQLQERSGSYQVPEKITHLMNQAVMALERSILLVETRQKSLAIETAYREQEEAYEHFLEAITKLLEARDGETKEHSWRVRRYSRLLGQEMNLSKRELEALDRGALLHDIGKINVRDAVLLKQGPLDDEEWQQMRTHPTIGASVVQLLPAWQDALPVITYHQERWDGSGYPLGLAGTDIPLLARIFAVADVYDALTSDRPYRSPMKPLEALDYIESQANIHFDPQVVRHMSRIIREKLVSG